VGGAGGARVPAWTRIGAGACVTLCAAGATPESRTRQHRGAAAEPVDRLRPSRRPHARRHHMTIFPHPTGPPPPPRLPPPPAPTPPLLYSPPALSRPNLPRQHSPDNIVIALTERQDSTRRQPRNPPQNTKQLSPAGGCSSDGRRISGSAATIGHGNGRRPGW